MNRLAPYLAAVALFAACSKTDAPATVPTTNDTEPPPGTDTAEPIGNDVAPDTAPETSQRRAQISQLTFADLEPAQVDDYFDRCLGPKTAAELCGCLTKADATHEAWESCKLDWYPGSGDWSIAELYHPSFQMYVLVHHDDGAHEPIGVAEFLSPRGVIQESYEAVSVAATTVGGMHVVEVVGALQTVDPDAPEDTSPPERRVSICRYDGAAIRGCSALNFSVDYALGDDGTLEIKAADWGPEPGVYDLLY